MSEFIADDNNDFVKVATITNESERIVRVVAKGNYSLTVEVLYCPLGRYEWLAEAIHVGREELTEMAMVVSGLPKEDA